MVWVNKVEEHSGGQRTVRGRGDVTQQTSTDHAAARHSTLQSRDVIYTSQPRSLLLRGLLHNTHAPAPC
ncbi:hypothetical protein E2C01_060886 [Portunus trituberculatus]|uniref:Uncharacterized protein n=1 Tax=Portunus trituberculatus TaxID=210409 RepID=A0A5B7HDK4_PORTR|nr:hypothetical protein [Portunus trituberculatus]